MNIYRPDGLIVASNTAVERMFHYPLQLILNSYNILDDPVAAANGNRAAFERALAGETATVPPNHFDPASIGIDQPPLWLTTTFFPFIAPGGGVTFIGGVYQDVTAQVQVEAESVRLTAELAERARISQPFYALAENAPDGFMLTSLDLRYPFRAGRRAVE